MSKLKIQIQCFFGDIFLSLCLLCYPQPVSLLLKMTLMELTVTLKEKEREYYRGMN